MLETVRQQIMECTIKIVDDIGRDDFLSQTKDGDKFSLGDTNEGSEWIEELEESCDYDNGKFYYNALNWTCERRRCVQWLLRKCKTYTGILCKC